MQAQARVRIPVFTVVVATVVMLVLSGLIVPWGGVTTVEADDPGIERIFVLETPVNYYGDVEILSPFWMDTANEYIVMRLCMSTLLTYDPEMNLVGDLAESWTVSPDGLTWTFELVDNAYFIDRAYPESTAHQVTADDVVYTYEVVQNYPNFLHSYLPGAIDGLQPTIQDVSKTITDGVSITLGEPFAPFLRALTWIPILPKYYWEPKEDATGDPSGDRQALPIGSGPFYYNLTDLPSDPQFGLPLKRNPIWFQEENRGWQIHIDKLVLKPWPQLIADEGLRWTELKNGNTDCLGISLQMYMIKESEPDAYVETYAQDKGHMYELVLNQMSEETRDDLVDAGMDQFEFGSNNQLLLDSVVKEAIGMCVDKSYLISDLPEENWLESGLATPADSPIPSCSEWHYTYGSEPGEVPLVFDPSAARTMLWNYGFKYDDQGNWVPVDSEVTPLCRVGGNDPLRFNLYAVYDPSSITFGSAIEIMVWADEAGIEIQINNDISHLSELSWYWYGADFDMILSNSRHYPTSDPSVDVLGRFTTDAIGSWLTSFPSNEVYDSLYEQSLSTIDPVTRGEVIDDMQRLLYEDMSYQCLAYSEDAYGVSTRYWEGYGDWEANPMLMPDQALPWLYMRISPVDNMAPVVQVDPLYEGEVDLTTSVSATISDESSLEYKWFWGDGTTSDWILGTSGHAEHTYTSDGLYVAYVAAKEVGGDGFITWNQTNIKVWDMSNTAPHAAPGYEDDPITYTPADPDMGDVITFTSHFVDDEDDELFYTWNFGDDYSAVGVSAEHQYTSADTFSVTLSVTDNHYGSGERPVVVGTLVNVAVNTIPAIDVPDYPNVIRQTSTDFSVTASDDDPLRFTWSWGDGDTTVTTVPTADHTYAVQGTYTLTVFADDLTGLSGHNASDTGMVNVKKTNTGPVIDSYTVSTTSAATGEMITFSGTARDAEGDPLRFTFFFDDGTFAVFDNGATLPDTAVTFSVDKAYSSAATFNTYLYVSDFIINESSLLNAITVVANDPPIVTALSDKDGTEGVSMSFSASAVDPDGDPLTYYWHFGDGTYASGQSVTHTYAVRGEYDFAVYVDDGNGHNETVGATAYVTAVPVLTPLEDQWITEGVVWTFEASATDADGDTITYTWDFGDGSPLEVGQTVTHAYPVTGVETDYDFTVWADDGSPLDGHNVSDTATATVVPSSIPSIKVTSPNGGEEWQAGFFYPITWTSSGEASNVTIELYFMDQYIDTVATATENDGFFDWRIPPGYASPLLWRIYITDGLTNDTSDEPFTILSSPKITLTYPAGGEVWEPGGTYSIGWTSEYWVFDSVKIQLLREGVPGLGGTIDLLITNGTEDDGEYSWTIPIDQPSRYDYHMIISGIVESVPDQVLYFHDWCDGFFTIEGPPSISVVSPNGGESWTAGTDHDITWTFTGFVGDVCIELLRSGSFDSTIVSSTENDGTYPWPVSIDMTEASDYAIRISEVSSSVEDSSNGSFSIVASGPTGPPTAPLNLNVAGLIDFDGPCEYLTWTYPEDDGGEILGWRIYRSNRAGVDLEDYYATWTGSNPRYYDRYVDPGKTYYYRISAYNSVGESPLSNEASDQVPRTGGGGGHPKQTIPKFVDMYGAVPGVSVLPTAGLGDVGAVATMAYLPLDSDAPEPTAIATFLQVMSLTLLLTAMLYCWLVSGLRHCQTKRRPEHSV